MIEIYAGRNILLCLSYFTYNMSKLGLENSALNVM